MRYLHSLIYHMHRRRTPKNHIFKKKLTLLCSTRCFSTLFATLFDATQTLLRRNSDASQTLLCSTRCFSTLFDATQAVRKRYSALLDAFRRYTMLLDATQTLLRRYSDATQTLLRRYSDATQTLLRRYSDATQMLLNTSDFQTKTIRTIVTKEAKLFERSDEVA
jgi:hypothetical protein